MMKFAGAMVLLATSVPTPVAPSIRQPTARWVVNFDDAQCLASRNFGTAEEPLILALKAPALGDVLQVAVIRSGRGGAPQQLAGSISFDDAKPMAASLLAFTPGKEPRRVFTTNVPTSNFSAASTATSISVIGGALLSERFSLDKIAAVLKVMDDCVADLRQVWNVSGTRDDHSSLKQRAKGDLLSVFRAEDYPAVAQSREQQGSLRFALLIDELGRVADCTTIETSGVASLDAQSCSIVKERAKFTPAKGPDGKPAKDSVVQRVTWRIEG